MSKTPTIVFRPPGKGTPDPGLSQPQVTAAETAIIVGPGDDPENALTWEDADIAERGPIQGITTNFGEIINLSDPSISPGTATWRATNVNIHDDRVIWIEITDADGLRDTDYFTLAVINPGDQPTVLFALDPETGNDGEWSAYLPLSQGVQLVGTWADPDSDQAAPMQDYMRVEIDGVDRTLDGTHQLSDRESTSGTWSWYSESVDLLDDEKNVEVFLRDFAGQEGSDVVVLKFRTDDILRDMPTHVSPKSSIWTWQEPAPDLEWDADNGGSTWAGNALPFAQGITIPRESVTMQHVAAVDGHYEVQFGLRCSSRDCICLIEVRVNGESIHEYRTNGAFAPDSGIIGERDGQDHVTDWPLSENIKAGDLIEIELTGINEVNDELPWLEWNHNEISPTEGPPTGELVFHWKAGEV